MSPYVVVAGLGALAVVIGLGLLLVRYAKRRTAGAYALGAVLIFFGLGNVREPDLPVLHQTQPPKKIEGDDPEAPPPS